jgi:hypothetical protein
MENQNQKQNPVSGKNQSDVSIGEWIITFILMAIPLVNIIMIFVWAFGGNARPSKANWAKASLVLFAIGIVLSIIFMSSIAAFFAAFGKL